MNPGPLRHKTSSLTTTPQKQLNPKDVHLSRNLSTSKMDNVQISQTKLKCRLATKKLNHLYYSMFKGVKKVFFSYIRVPTTFIIHFSLFPIHDGNPFIFYTSIKRTNVTSCRNLTNISFNPIDNGESWNWWSENNLTTKSILIDVFPTQCVHILSLSLSPGSLGWQLCIGIEYLFRCEKIVPPNHSVSMTKKMLGTMSKSSQHLTKVYIGWVLSIMDENQNSIKWWQKALLSSNNGIYQKLIKYYPE